MEKYRPSNGTEGEGFIGKFCERCVHGKYEHTGNVNDSPCQILSASFVFDVEHKDYPNEWIYDESGSATCTAWRKWDWGYDDETGWNDPPIPEPIDPNQYVLPFIEDEIMGALEPMLKYQTA